MNLQPQFDLARLGLAIAKMKGDLLAAVEYTRDKSWERPERICRAAVNSGTTSDPDFASKLVEYRNVSSAFLAAIEVLSPLDMLAGMAAGNIPAKKRIVLSTIALSGSVVAEGAPKPVSSLAFDTTLTEEQKAIAIVVMSDELLRMSDSAAVTLIQRELANGCAAAANVKFLADLAAAASTAGTIAGGTDFLADLHDAVSAITSRGTGRAVAIVPPAVAVDLAMDARSAFDQMTPNGGTVRGVRVLVSDQVPNGTDVVVVDPSKLNIDPGVVTLATANAGALQMDDNPSAGAQNLVSLYQTNSAALRAERRISYAILRENAAAVITNADYSPTP
jgi:HK97 family phage major capsid protein